MTTSKSPKAVAVVAYETAQNALPPYHHRYSPKKFTQPQLFACLVLKEFFTTDYRGIEAILEDSSDLRQVLQLQEVPHFTTLQKAAQRLTNKRHVDKLFKKLIDRAIEEKIMHKSVRLCALDSTGFESHHVSTYFVKRKAKGLNIYQMTHYTRFPKVGIAIDCDSFLVLAGIPSLGPSPDITHFKQAVHELTKWVSVKRLVADAGYDSEESHRFAREEHGIYTLIPNRVGRPTGKLPTGKYRRRMVRYFNMQDYGKRWFVETVHSVIKNQLGSFLRARSYWSQTREMMLKLFTFDAMVVRCS